MLFSGVDFRSVSDAVNRLETNAKLPDGIKIAFFGRGQRDYYALHIGFVNGRPK